MNPWVSVVIPAWKSGGFIAETLESLTQQTLREFAAIISVDGSDEATVAECQRFMGDSRFSLTLQSERLGWVNNTNAGLALVRTRYATILPHDDLVAPDYLESLLRLIQQQPGAACVYCDVEMFGDHEGRITQPSVAGTPLVRQLALLIDHMSAVAFRGVFRSDIMTNYGSIPSSLPGDFAADTVWMNRMALAGDLLRLPQTLFRKRYHPGNTHTKWKQWDEQRKLTAWVEHCEASLTEALRIGLGPSARALLFLAAFDRLLQRTSRTDPFLLIRELPVRRVEELAEAFRRRFPEDARSARTVVQ